MTVTVCDGVRTSGCDSVLCMGAVVCQQTVLVGVTSLHVQVVQYRLELAQKVAKGAGWWVLQLNQHAVATAVDRHMSTALMGPPVASVVLETTSAKL